MPDEEQNETTEETPEEPQADVVEETPAAEEPQADEPQAEEPEAEEPPAAEEPQAEEPAAEAEPAPADEPAEGADEAAAEPAAEAEGVSADAPAEGADEAAPQQPTHKPKRKRLPRSERHKHSKPKRERPAERRPIVRLPKPEHERGRRQERRGVVVSDAMDKTIVVKVDTVKAHPRYKKVIRRSTKFHAHDEQNAAKVGDVVRIVETRPLSKTKNWRLAEVLEVAK
jgi:small subunit ribosomal protein S17